MNWQLSPQMNKRHRRQWQCQIYGLCAWSSFDTYVYEAEFCTCGQLPGRAETERDGTRTETRFGFPAKRTSPFISAGVSVQSAAGSRGVRISGSNAG